MSKTTKKDFELFCSECDKWVQHFRLADYYIYYTHEDCESLDFPKAYWMGDIENRSVTIGLAIDFKDVKPTKNLIKKMAFHEVFHIILGRLDTLARSRYLMERELDEEREAIIRRMENTFFDEVELF